MCATEKNIESIVVYTFKQFQLLDRNLWIIKNYILFYKYSVRNLITYK